MGLFDEFLDDSSQENEQEQANIPGVAIGVVKENWDSKHPGMVKVEISLGISGKNLTDWAPVAVPYAGKEFGMYFLPEVGTQVLVAFHRGEINCPIVIGCLWNQQDVVPPQTANEKNSIKTICTKGGNRIMISEEGGKETITIETKGKQRLELNDEKKTMSMQDEKGKNGVTIDAKNGEIKVVCEKKAVFQVNGKAMLTLDGKGQSAELKTGKINIQADQELKLKGNSMKVDGSSTQIKGQSIKMEAQASLELKGTASLKAESSGIAAVKGTMVKIN